jgi:hypothetical protein
VAFFKVLPQVQIMIVIQSDYTKMQKVLRRNQKVSCSITALRTIILIFAPMVLFGSSREIWK